jgi:hypothetical protein
MRPIWTPPRKKSNVGRSGSSEAHYKQKRGPREGTQGGGLTHEANAGRSGGVPEPQSRSSVFWRTWRSSPRGQTFKRPPAGVRDLDDSKLDLRVAVLHSFNPYCCEFTANEISHRLKLEPEGIR